MIVLDGDTFILDGERIRVQGYNTPELHSPACPHERELAYQARAFLRAWLERKPIIIRQGTDKYGRTLARLVPDPGPELIRQGLAEKFVCAPSCPKRRNWCND